MHQKTRFAGPGLALATMLAAIPASAQSHPTYWAKASSGCPCSAAMRVPTHPTSTVDAPLQPPAHARQGYLPRPTDIQGQNSRHGA